MFGRATPSGTWSVWDVAWKNAGGGQTRVADITGGTSNTLAVVEKPMVTGDAVVSVRDWVLYGSTPPQPDGANTWCVTDTPPEATAFFGSNCKDPRTSSGNTYGQWWLNRCRFGDDPNEYFQPPSPRRLVPEQQNVHNIYSFNAAGVQALLCDGSVRMIAPTISVPVWSAAVTPSGGEAAPLDQ